MKPRCALWLALAAAAAAQPVYLVHDDPEPMQALAASLRGHGLEVRLQDQAAFSKGSQGTPARAICMYVHGTIDPAVEDRLIRYAELGGRLIVLHHGAASGKMSAARWMPFLGLRILSRDAPEHAWNVLRGSYQLVNLNPRHYVTSFGVGYDRPVPYTPSDNPSVPQQLPSIELSDTEVFLNQLFADARNKTVLLGMKTEIGGREYMQDRGGWLMPAGQGHVFYFQPGHRARDFEHPAYARILLNAVRWRPEAVPPRPVVALDGFHNKEKDPHYRWEGDYSGGFSQLGTLLQDMGAELRTVREPLTPRALAGLDCLIVVDPDTPAESAVPRYISGAEVGPVVAWVAGGGKLLLLGNSQGNAEFLHFNRLSRRFGFEFEQSTLRDAAGNGALNLPVPATPPVFPRPGRFYAVDVAPLKLTAPGARALLRLNGAVVMGIVNPGRGIVIALGDPWLYNEYIRSGDNRMLATDLFRYLLFQ